MLHQNHISFKLDFHSPHPTKTKSTVYVLQMVEQQLALKLLPWDCKPFDKPEVMNKPELVEFLCDSLQLEWTGTEHR